MKTFYPEKNSAPWGRKLVLFFSRRFTTRSASGGPRISSAIFLLAVFTAIPAQAQELSKETVSSIWPFPHKILKVIAAPGTLRKEGKTIRMADVTTKSPTTDQCVAHQTRFIKTASSWAFDSVVSEITVSCKDLKAKKGAVPSSGSSSPSADPRDHVEEGISEVDRTVNDVEAVENTVERIKGLF